MRVSLFEHPPPLSRIHNVNPSLLQKCSPPLPILKHFGMGLPFSNAQRMASGFRLPDLSCLATRRMLLAMGLMGMLPALKVRDMLNQTKPL